MRDVECEYRLVIGDHADASLEHLPPKPWVYDEDATATINYTSGTTARPKGVQLTHRNIWLNATTFGWQLGITDRDVYLHTLPQFHCNGWGVLYAVTGMGAKHIIIRKIDGTEILRRVQAARCDGDVRRAGRGQRDPRRRAELGGRDPRARHDADLLRRRAAADEDDRADRAGARLGVHPDLRAHRDDAAADDEPRPRPSSTACRPARRRPSCRRAGGPAIGVEMRISPDGEVLARGNHIMEGYWSQPDATAAAIHPASDDPTGPDWFHTGDGGLIDDDNYVTISDRKKDVIISGGENVSSIEVEDAVFSHPEVAEVAVIGIPDEKWGELVTALVVVTPGSSLTPDEIIAYTRTKLAGYKCPKKVELRDSLARTATGKLQKFKLRDPYWQGLTRQVN